MLVTTSFTKECDLPVIAGEPLEGTLTVVDSAGTVVVVTSDWSVKSQVRSNSKSDTVLHEWTSEGDSPNVTVDGSGHIVIRATGLQTMTWFLTWHNSTVWDMFATDPDGVPHKILKGRVFIEPSVTRIP